MTLDYPDPALDDGVVRLRRWSAGDLECVRRAAEDPRIRRGTTVPAVFTEAAGHAFLERQWARVEQAEGVSLAITAAATGEALGAAVLTLRPQAGVTGIGYWLLAPARGRGLATRAVGLLSGWAVRDAGLTRVEAWVEPGNVASQRVLERAGLQREGVLRSLLRFEDGPADAVVFSLIPADMPEG